MKKMSKRGLSPVLATVLLIVLALVLVMIVFAWARSWIGEKIGKDMGEGPEAIESFCDDVNFVAEAQLTPPEEIGVNNIGNIPLYGIEVVKRSGGTAKNIGGARFDNVLTTGRGEIIDGSSILSGVGNSDELIILPVLLGESDEHKRAYTCDEEFGKFAEIV